MSRYDWPPERGSKQVRRGRSRRRREHNQAANQDFGTTDLLRARARRHSLGAEEFVATAAPPPDGPAADQDLWVPLGPAGTLRGQADSDPRVSGRVRDLAVSPDGRRAYAASAMGGLWYSDTAGARWEPVGAWAMVTAPADVPVASFTLTCGALHVAFAGDGDPAGDEVWVGTGEPGVPGRTPLDLGAGGGQYAGVGILHATGPVAASRTSPLQDPWSREAQERPADGYPGLAGAGLYRLAADPDDDQHLVAASTRGLHERVGGSWQVRQVPAWEAVSAGASGLVAVTDVAWTPATAAHDARLWVAVVSPAVPALDGLWVGHATGDLVQVALPGWAPVRRLGLAVHPGPPAVVYALGSGPLLWRVDDLAATPVDPVPGQLFQPPDGNDQSDYDLAVAVDPTDPDRVLLGGSTGQSPHDGSWAASLYRITLGARQGAGAAAHYPTDYGGDDTSDATWVGAEVHADVHSLRWLDVDAGHVWVCCDGGVFRSTAAGDTGTFTSRATGMAVTEPGYVAAHPLSDGVLLCGVQDNGTQLRIGDSVWRRAREDGDGGGVAFDPGAPGRFVTQSTGASWADDRGDVTPAWRGTAGQAAFDTEDRRSRFYSPAAVVRRPDGVTQLAVGTTRVWYSEQWGRSWWDGWVWRRHWVALPVTALPSAPVDPRAGDNPDTATSSLEPLSGPPPRDLDTGRGVHVLRWAGPDRLYVLQRGAVHRVDRDPAVPTSWSLTTLLTRLPLPLLGPPPETWPAAQPLLPPAGALNDLAVHDAAAGVHGSLYVAASHPTEPLWWFDGTATWHPCRLGTEATAPPAGATEVPVPADGVRAPAYAVVVDPDDPAAVYVGTTVGVWRGRLTTPGPTWSWTPYSSGLPEAAVQDLSLATWPRAGGPPLKLLRAALQARGVWEVEPDADTAPTTYLRVHPYDSRRVLPSPTADPLWHAPRPERGWPLDWADARNRDHRRGARPADAPDGTPPGEHPWHASPDVRLRPAPRLAADPAVPPPRGLPWTSLPDDRFWLWSLQTALSALDPLVVPDGRWTAWFRRRVAAIRVDLGVDGGAGRQRVDRELWEHPAVQAGFWTEPWADGGPTETDLVERVYGAATRRVGGVQSRATSPAGAAALPRRYHVDVCVHHRGREPAPGTEVAVALLTVPLPTDPADWASAPPPALPTGAALTALRAALDGLPADGGSLPGGLALPAGWAAADPARAVRRPDRPVASSTPGVVTFDLDLTGAAARSRFLLLALAHSSRDPVAVTGADLRAAVLGSRHLAARSVEVL